MKQYSIPIISGRLEKPAGPDDAPNVLVHFRAEDWRRRGGDINIYFSPSSDRLKSLPSEPEESYEPMYLEEIDDQQVVKVPKIGRYKNAEFQTALANALGHLSRYWKCKITNIKIEAVTQQQYVNLGGEDIPYEKYVERQMVATIMEADIRPWIMACAQAAQRLEYLSNVEYLYLGPSTIIDHKTYYAVNPTDQPIYFLVRSLYNEAKPIPEQDKDRYRSSVLGSVAFGTIRYTIEQFLKEWEEGHFQEFNIQQIAHFLRQTIDWFCDQYNLDKHKYFHAQHDYLHKAQVMLVGIDPNTWIPD